MMPGTDIMLKSILNETKFLRYDMLCVPIEISLTMARKRWILFNVLQVLLNMVYLQLQV